mgnify:CR=1 FL=1
MKINRIIIIVVNLIILFGCQSSLTKKEITGVYINELMGSKIIINNSNYIYKVNNITINQNKYQLTDSPNEIIFFDWLDSEKANIYGNFIESRMCIVPISHYGLAFSPDEPHKDFVKLRGD